MQIIGINFVIFLMESKSKVTPIENKKFDDDPKKTKHHEKFRVHHWIGDF